MAFIHPQEKQINCKIVYCGASLSGKSTNFYSLLKTTGSGKQDKSDSHKVITLAESEDRTLFFDFMPMAIDKIKGHSVRFHLYTVPGQPLYENSRKIILKGVDGIIFVIDSRLEPLESALSSWRDLQANLCDLGVNFGEIPLVFQYNKRDLEDRVPVEELNRLFNQRKLPFFEAVATKGVGCLEPLQALCKQVLIDLKKS